MNKIRWQDLAAPGPLIRITFDDAISTIPTLIVMALCFFAGILVLYVIKKLVVWGLMVCARQPYGYKKWVAKKVDRNQGSKMAKVTWETTHTHRWFNYIHIFIESLFFLGIVVTVLLAASFGGINVWQNPIALSVITVAVGYVFASGLQQLGSGYFFFLTNSMSPDEWWEQIGGGISGRVCNITPFYVEFEGKDTEHGGLVLQRAPMTTVFMSSWQRNYYKESAEIRLTTDADLEQGPPRMKTI
jgi:hypothetical protein